MKRFWKVGLACLLLGAGTVLAEPADVQAKLDTRIDMGLSKAAPEDVFRSFAKLMGMEAVVDPGVKGAVSIELHNVRVRTQLDAVCESIGCRWNVEAGNPPRLRVVPVRVEDGSRSKSPDLRDPIDLKVTRANGLELLKTFGEILGAETAVDPGLKGEVTLNLEKTPVDQALDTVCQALGCDWKYTEGGNGRRPVLRFVPRSKRG